MSQPRGLKISPNYYVEDWRALHLDHVHPDIAEWDKAVAILRDRIVSRFLRPADTLIAAEAEKDEGTFGFAILALDFLVVETIEGFRQGVKNHDKLGKDLFVSFLLGWDDFHRCVIVGDPKVKATALYKQGRCALHHSGSTEKLQVGRSGPMIVFGEDALIKINRTTFHRRLADQFERYLRQVTQPGAVETRRNLAVKMNYLCAN